MDLEPITIEANNYTDNEIDAGALNTAIKDTNVGPAAGRSNNDIHNEVDIIVSSVSGAAVKDTDVEPTANGANNDTNAEVDTGLFMGDVISITDRV